MTQDEFNTLAWRDFIVYALTEPDLIAAFTAATGLTLPNPVTSPIEKLVDQATRATERTLAAFVDWITENHWGVEYAPTAWRKAKGLS